MWDFLSVKFETSLRSIHHHFRGWFVHNRLLYCNAMRHYVLKGKRKISTVFFRSYPWNLTPQWISNKFNFVTNLLISRLMISSHKNIVYLASGRLQGTSSTWLQLPMFGSFEVTLIFIELRCHLETSIFWVVSCIN